MTARSTARTSTTKHQDAPEPHTAPGVLPELTVNAENEVSSVSAEVVAIVVSRWCAVHDPGLQHHGAREGGRR